MRSLREQSIRTSEPETGHVRGLIEKIERYRIHDGPGIRTAVFFMGCPLKCAWCSNPETWSMKPALMYRVEACTGCFSCIEACPENIIVEDGGNIRIDREKCTGCAVCVDACPSSALTSVGRWQTVDEVVEEVIKDRPFFDASGGGVTLTGGEPTMQMDFLEKVCERLKEEYVSVAVDTCGMFNMTAFRKVLPRIDCVLFDLKAADPSLHQVYTGSDNSMILNNLRLLDSLGVNLIIRMIIIPGINDGAAEIDKKISVLRGLKNVKRVDILPYHTLGAEKYGFAGIGLSHAG